MYIDLGDTGEWEHFSNHYCKGRNAKPMEDLIPLLDKDVSDVLNSNKSIFNEEKAAADLKASQKEERDLINVKIAEAIATASDP